MFGPVDVLMVIVLVPLGFCDVGGGVVADVVGRETTAEDEGDEATTVVVIKLCVTDCDVNGGVEGVTMTVAVELSRQPPLTQV